MSKSDMLACLLAGLGLTLLVAGYILGILALLILGCVLFGAGVVWLENKR